MSNSTRFLALSLLCAVVALPSAGCDPCSAEPDLCAGLPGTFGTDGDATRIDVDGEDDDASADGGQRRDPGADDGTPENAGGTDGGGAEGGGGGDVDGGEVDPAETDGDEESGGESGGETGGGASDGAESDEGDSGETEDVPDPYDALACYDRYGACLHSGATMSECRVGLRICLADAGFDTPQGDCLDAITECILDGNEAHGCVVGDAAASCAM